MKRKALLLGALPKPRTGPWVSTTDAREWRVDPRANYRGEVVVEILTDGGPPSTYPLDDKEVRFSAERARAIIRDRIGTIPVKRITVNIEAIL